MFLILKKRTLNHGMWSWRENIIICEHYFLYFGWQLKSSASLHTNSITLSQLNLFSRVKTKKAFPRWPTLITAHLRPNTFLNWDLMVILLLRKSLNAFTKQLNQPNQNPCIFKGNFYRQESLGKTSTVHSSNTLGFSKKGGRGWCWRTAFKWSEANKKYQVSLTFDGNGGSFKHFKWKTKLKFYFNLFFLLLLYKEK
jgi:hypothetical protein